MVPEGAKDAALKKHLKHSEGAVKFVNHFFLIFGFDMRVMLKCIKHCALPQDISTNDTTDL